MKKLKKIYIEITNSCNLNCVFCIKNSREIKFVTFDEFKIILKKVKKYTDYLYFHLLGEPLLHPLINEFIDYASAEGFNINITTNGYLISKIKHNKNIRQLNVSLHSFDLKYNKSLKDYMSDILTSAECLAKNNTYISFRFWVDNPNSNYMIEILNSYFKTNIKLDEFKENLKIIENIFINKFHIFNWPNLDNSYYCEYGKCYGLIDHIGILSDGTIVPCCLDTKGIINLGNIFYDELYNIFNSNRVKNIIKGFNENKKHEELCKKCDFLEKN